MKNIFLPVITAALMALASPVMAAPSILDIKHSITDDNIVPPESFETKTRELEENFYLRNYVVSDGANTGVEKLGTAKEYEKRLASLPTTIEMPYNDIVGRLINMYLGKRRGLVANMLALHNYYGNIFLEELEKEGMPTELQYLPVIESAINPNAVSRAGAAGLWQFMPATAKGLGMEVNSLVDERRDPRMASRNAARYLHQLHDIYDDWSLAIAAYNCGPGNVNKALRRAGGGKKDFWEIYNYLPKETRGYVPAFIAANYVMNFYRHHNIAPTVVKRHLTTDTIHVDKRIHFNQIAEVLNIPVDEIRMLNPQYRQDIIPGNFHPYVLTLPKQQCLSFLMSEDAILAHDADLYAQRTYVEPGGDSEAPQFVIDESGDRNLAALERQSANADANMLLAAPVASGQGVKRLTHTVGRGENLRDIAKQYGVSATDIKRWNKLRRGKVKEGDELTIEIRTLTAPEDRSLVAAAPVKRPADSKQTDVPQPKAKQPKAAPAEVPQPKKRTEEPQAQPPAPKKQAVEQPRKSRRQQEQPEPEKPAKKKNNSKKDNAPKKAKTTTYTVKSGDSLEKIARKNNTTVEEIRKANGMKANQDRIDIGQDLKIPSKNAKVSKGNGKNSKGAKGSKRKSSKKRRR